MVKQNFKEIIQSNSNQQNPNFVNSTSYTLKAIQADKKRTIKLIERLQKQIKNWNETLKEKEQDLIDATEFISFLAKLESNL
jgi:hypothetical protein